MSVYDLHDETIAAKMIVYAGEDDEYFTLISPEAWKALKEWMNYRETSGERINNNSWVMRDLWDTRVSQGIRKQLIGRQLTYRLQKSVNFIGYYLRWLFCDCSKSNKTFLVFFA
jgi:hypothetical protein